MDEYMRERITDVFVRLTVAFVRSYRGHRTKMWSRIPDAMCSAARQSSRVDKWYTTTLRTLQIDSQGSAASDSSLCSIWTDGRLRLRSALDDVLAAERASLRLLRDERATIVAMAQIRWDDRKAARAAHGDKT